RAAATPHVLALHPRRSARLLERAQYQVHPGKAGQVGGRACFDVVVLVVVSHWLDSPLVPCPAGVGPPVLARPSLRSSLAFVFGCSYAICLLLWLAPDVLGVPPARRAGGQTLCQPLELVAPPGVVGARQAAQ